MRVADAEVLLDAGKWPAAYYLLGYAVECALKACAARQFQRDKVPEKALVNDFYTHRFDRLLGISGAGDALEARADVDRAFAENWTTVRAWSEASRYHHSVSESAAREMVDAVTNPTSGVLTWLSTQW